MSRTTPADASVTIRQRLLRLYRHRAIALAGFLVVVCAAIPFILTLPPLYRASATVLIEGAVPGIGPEQTPAGVDARLQAIKQEAFSRARLLGLVEQFDLYPAMRRRVPQEVLLDRLQKDIRIDVRSTEQSSSAVAFTVSYLGCDPKTAAEVANTLASFFVNRNDTIRTRQVAQTTRYLDEQIAETKKRLDAQAERLTQAARSGGAMPQQVLANISSLELLNTQLQQNGDEQLKLSERRMNLQKDLADLSARGPDEATDPAGALLTAKRKELSGLLAAGHKDTHPDVRTLRNEIAGLEKRTGAPSAAATVGSAQRSTLQASLRETESRLSALAAEKQSILDRIRSQQGQVAGAAVREPAMKQLTSDYQATRDSYDLLLKQRDQARLNERAASGDSGEAFRVVDPAVAPGGSVGPNRRRLLLVALAVAVLVGLGAAMLADRSDTSFGSVDELRAFTRVPVLASIPRIATRRDTRSRWAKGLAAGAASLVVLVAVAAASIHIAQGNELVARLLLHLG